MECVECTPAKILSHIQEESHCLVLAGPGRIDLHRHQHDLLQIYYSLSDELYKAYLKGHRCEIGYECSRV